MLLRLVLGRYVTGTTTYSSGALTGAASILYWLPGLGNIVLFSNEDES